MAEITAQDRARLARLVLVPGLIALAVTLLRLTGELLHWSTNWFYNDAGGITPSGVSWVVGIVWLPVPFGVYFALRLIAAGRGPASPALAILCSAGGLLILYAGQRLIVTGLTLDLRLKLLLIWAVSVVPALALIKVWPALWRVLLVYGLASRLPVALIMFFAMRGRWGTHYDYAGQIPPEEFGFAYVWLALIPQLVFWVGFTILLGMLAGAVAAAIRRYRRPSAASATLNATG
jgi:hypothetical protein